MTTMPQSIIPSETPPRYRRKNRDAHLLQRASGVTPPRIGEFWQGQGGLYAGIMRGEAGQRDYHLILPTDVKACIKSIMWSEGEHGYSGALSDVDGFANTMTLCKSANNHPAAKWAQALSLDGHHDFYLPARYELLLVYLNLSRRLPLHHCYWSSTPDAGKPGCSWVQDFNYGDQFTHHQASRYHACAVRRVLMEE